MPWNGGVIGGELWPQGYDWVPSLKLLCISDWKLYISPQPALSYRTLVACRLLHIRSVNAVILDTQSTSWEPDVLGVQNYEEDSYDRWKACVLGYVDTVSTHNENKVRKTLSTLCDQILADAVVGIERVVTEVNGMSSATSLIPPWIPFTTECIKHLWQEQADVALAVRIHIDSGAEL